MRIYDVMLGEFIDADLIEQAEEGEKLVFRTGLNNRSCIWEFEEC